jgi:hypothetical protein
MAHGAIGDDAMDTSSLQGCAESLFAVDDLRSVLLLSAFKAGDAGTAWLGAHRSMSHMLRSEIRACARFFSRSPQGELPRAFEYLP